MNFEWDHAPAVEVRKQTCTYTAEDPERASRFVNGLEAVKAKILRNPETPREFEAGYREMRMDSFPFTLIYTIEGKTIWVVAFVHNSRHQDYWKRNS